MDIEKTIEFLVQNAARHDAQMSSVESSLLTLGDGLIKLTGVVKTVAESLERLTDVVDELRDEMRERDAQSRERDAAIQSELRQHAAEVDERLAILVSAIGALINERQQPPSQQP